MKKKYLIPFALTGVLALSACPATEKGSDVPTSETSGVEPSESSSSKPAQSSSSSKQEIEYGSTIYVSANGTDTATGTEKDPVSFTTAINVAKPGNTLLLAEGTYESNMRIGVYKSGTAGKYITVKPQVPGTRVVFDFSSQVFDGSNRGIQIYGDYWHFYDIEIYNAGDNGMYVAGNHNIIEECMFYGNRDTGLQLGRGYANETSIDEWPSHNLIKNCTSFGNYDAETLGENADGYAAKLTLGYGNVFDGCIAFRNSDDGWDMFAKEDSGTIGTAVLYNCVAFENGYLPYAIDKTLIDGSVVKTYDTPNGDGIGFKLGGSVMTGDVLINNCLAYNNKLHGFGDNSNPGVIGIKYSTAINNCTGIEKDKDGNETGNISTTRGIDGIVNKSNNIDLARTNGSYNNYYGVLSYTNNQTKFDPNTSDSSYNLDQFKGSVAYSIFNTNYNKGEVYKAYTGYTDGSSYSEDAAFDHGTDYDKLNDDCFASLESINPICKDKADLSSLLSYHEQLRNDDGSVNMGDTCRVVDPTLLTYVNGKSIGATLNKTSSSEYEHYGNAYIAEEKSDDQVQVDDCLATLEVLADKDAIFQNFELLTIMNQCSISWTSSDESVVKIPTHETISASTAISLEAEVISPETTKTVTLTAEITCGSAKATKEFTLTVRSRNQSLGELKSSGQTSMRVNMYSTYVQPRIYAVDSSSNTQSELSSSLYNLVYSYKYAKDGNSKYYKVDGVYTAVPGVYEVTVKATYLPDPTQTSTLVYNVYIVDPNCSIDLKADASYKLTRDGFTITGSLSNIEGKLYTLVSDTEIEDITAEKIISNENVQMYHIESDQLETEFLADNKNVKSGITQYYAYYVITNQNESNVASAVVRSFTVDIKQVSTVDEMYQICTTGKIGTTTLENPTIYSLSNDLDFANYNWVINKKDKNSAFAHLFNGNGHTIKNLTISGQAEGEKTITCNMFYKVTGTVMNLNFDNIVLNNTDFDTDYGKQVGIVGDLQGGYLHNIRITNCKAHGKESVAALCGQVTGGKNLVSQCSLVNPISEDPLKNEYVISATNKYAAGLIANAQRNSDQLYVDLTIEDCYVKAIIGDGGDAGGNTGGILGRAKNDFVADPAHPDITCQYYITINRCVYEGTIIANGQYNAGIVGDFDNGAGKISINYCISWAKFIYKEMVLDAEAVYNDYLDNGVEITQKYAHKNSNPIVGRAVKGASGVYKCQYNFGTWNEYYSSYVSSGSLVFDTVTFDDETGERFEFKLTQEVVKNQLKYDFDNIWKFNTESHLPELK